MIRETVNLFWFRRDLRLQDNTGLYHALRDNRPVLPVFIFDKTILDELEDREDRRVEFIREALLGIQRQLARISSTLEVCYGFPADIFPGLLKKYSIEKVFFNHDYEPYAIRRDKTLGGLFREHGAEVFSFKDQVIFEKGEIVKEDERPYTVFTPYSRRWKSSLKESDLEPFPTEKYFHNFHKQDAKPVPSLESMGFLPGGRPFPGRNRMIKSSACTQRKGIYRGGKGPADSGCTFVSGPSVSGNWQKKPGS